MPAEAYSTDWQCWCPHFAPVDIVHSASSSAEQSYYDYVTSAHSTCVKFGMLKMNDLKTIDKENWGVEFDGWENGQSLGV